MKISDLYHATNQVFEKFDTSIGLGIHFGTKKAALDRMKALHKPDFRIDHVKPSEKDLNCKKFIDILNFKYSIENPVLFNLNQIRSITSSLYTDFSSIELIHNSSHPNFEKVKLVDLAMEEIAPKTSMDPVKLRNTITLMSSEEIRSAIKEYASFPKSPSFLRSLSIAEEGECYIVHVNEQRHDSAPSRSAANAIVRELKSKMMREVQISIENPLRMLDLGTWTPEILAKELSLDNDQNELLYNLNSDVDKFNYLKSIIFEKGFDSIVYENRVEGKGSDSYIALKDNQIEIKEYAQPTFEYI